MSKPQTDVSQMMFRAELTQAQEFSLYYPAPSMKDIEDIKQKLAKWEIDLTSKDTSSKHK